MFDIKNSILTAKNRIQSYIQETPLDYSWVLSKLTQSKIYLKCENIQFTGAFKVRGAFNKLLQLTTEQHKRGVVTASSGNHGAAVAFGLNQLKIPGIIFVPDNASSAKVSNIRNFDIPLVFHGTDCMQTELHALEYAKKHNHIYVSPYNDVDVICGQGTIAPEILKKLPQPDFILVPVGGGGLISGIAGYIKSITPKTQIIGCLPENSPIMAESIKAGKIIERKTLETLSDATAGGIEPYSITFDFCKRWVDDFVLVTEDEIKNALITVLKTQRLLIEGAAALAIAALLKNQAKYLNKKVVIILSGANISIEVLKKILS